MKKLIQLTLCKSDPKMEFSEEEFFSKLKGQSVNKDDYDNSKKKFLFFLK